MIFTATPTVASCGSVRTTSPRNLNIILLPSLLNSTEKLINSPGAQAGAAVQKYTPDALTSRVIPSALVNCTGNAVWIRCPVLFSGCSVFISRATPERHGTDARRIRPSTALRVGGLSCIVGREDGGRY